MSDRRRITLYGQAPEYIFTFRRGHYTLFNELISIPTGDIPGSFHDDFEHSITYPNLSSLLGSRVALIIEQAKEEHGHDRAYRISCKIKSHR